MPNYQNGKIYTIRSHQTDQIYIGSTSQRLSRRMEGHRTNYKKYQNGTYHYVSSFEIVKYEDCYIELLEECKCENKAQLEKREGELIRENVCINKRIPGRTRAEHYQDTKEQQKQYREDNKEHILEQSRQYSRQYREDNKERLSEKFNCECGGKYQRGTKARHMKSIKHQQHIEAQQ
jgi:hypothetical protein